jgi:capsular exopolysaccharide synthesis family protein
MPTPHDPRDVIVEPYGESSQLAQRWQVLRRHLPLLVLAAVLGAATGWYLQHKQGPLYRATTTVRFTDIRSRVVGSNDASPDPNWQWDPVKSQSELLTTRATLEGAVDSGLLQLSPVAPASLTWLTAVDVSKVAVADTLSFAFNPAGFTATFHGQNTTGTYGVPVRLGDMSFTVASLPPAATAKFGVAVREDVISSLRGVTVDRRLDTDIADFSLEGSDPVFVQRALNAMTLSLQTLSQASDKEFAQERRRFLDQQARKTDSILEVQRARLSQFRTSSQAYNTKEKISQEQQSLGTLRTRREELAADRDVFQTLLNNAVTARQAGDPSRLRSLIGAPGISDNTLIVALFSKLQRLSLTRDSLTKGPSAIATTNPDVQGISAQIESATDDLIEAVRSQVTTYNARIAALDGLAQRASAQVSTLPTTEAEEDRLLQETEATQKIADQLNEEQQRARIAEMAQGGKVEVIDLARLPESVINPGFMRRVALGALVALALTLMGIFVYEELDTSLRRKSDIEKLLLLPTLGSIPALDRHVGNGQNNLLKRLGVGGNGKSHSNGKSLATQSSSPVFESYRAIRTSLIFSNAVESLRSVAITSASPGDGKSTTVANLATAFAQQGLRVIVFDCDLRRGSLHKILRIPRSPGLTQAIASGAELSAVARETSVANLSIVTTGVQPPNPSELLGSQRLRELLLQAQEQYDLVLIDTPPVLAAPDASVLASMVDGVILLVRVGATTRTAARTAQERLNLVGARILGTVLNDPKEMLDATQEYYHYEYTSNDAS